MGLSAGLGPYWPSDPVLKGGNTEADNLSIAANRATVGTVPSGLVQSQRGASLISKNKRIERALTGRGLQDTAGVIKIRLPTGSDARNTRSPPQLCQRPLVGLDPAEVTVVMRLAGRKGGVGGVCW